MSRTTDSTEDLEPPALIGSTKQLHALIDTVPDGMVVIDETGAITSFSQGAEEMFGYVEAEVLGKNVGLLMPPPDRESHDRHIQRYLATGEKHIIGVGQVTTAKHREGHTFPINLAIGELIISGKKTFVGHIRDLTEKQQNENKLHRLLDELAHITRISSMGSLASSLAHELNQPLTAVANYAHSARDLLKEPSQENVDLAREALDECAEQAIRAGQIVQRLREFIRHGETGRQIASLRRLVKEASALALMNGDGRGVDFETSLDAELDQILVDQVQVQQIVLNLLRNALEAMLHSQKRQLRVTSFRHSEDFVRVVVSDSGPGMNAQVASRLFEAFNTNKPDGMGLGLSICRDLVQSHGGKIWTEPSELGGTAMHFTLPLAKVGEEF